MTSFILNASTNAFTMLIYIIFIIIYYCNFFYTTKKNININIKSLTAMH